MGMSPAQTGRVGTTGDAHIPADIEQSEDAYIAAAFEQQRPRYLVHHRTTYGAGTGFETYEPAYRYGHALAHQPELRGKTWAEVQPEAKRQWEARQQCRFDPYESAIREAWEGVNMGL